MLQLSDTRQLSIIPFNLIVFCKITKICGLTRVNHEIWPMKNEKKMRKNEKFA